MPFANISLCNACANYDSLTNHELDEVYRDADLGHRTSVWCKATDRPEDERWQTCANFIPYGGEEQ